MTYVQRDSASPTRTSSFFIQTLGRITLVPFRRETPSSTDCTKSFISSSFLVCTPFSWQSYFSSSAKKKFKSWFPLRIYELPPMSHSSPKTSLYLAVSLLFAPPLLAALLFYATQFLFVCVCVCVCVCVSLSVTHTHLDLSTFYRLDPTPSSRIHSNTALSQTPPPIAVHYLRIIDQ